jgi:hypothetical protein
MIQVILAYNREVLNFLVKDKEIFYTDRKWKAWIRCLPPPEDLIKQIKLSRNRIPEFISYLFNFTDEELKEYANAKTEEDLANIIINDAKNKGCKLVKMEKIENEPG